MNDVTLLAATWIGEPHRLWGLDWSYLDIIGFIGQMVFSVRFLVQWVESERKGQSVIPVSFWYWSIVGSIILSVYWIFKRSPIGIFANLPNTIIYMRNLHLIRRHRLAATAAATSQTPHEES